VWKHIGQFEQGQSSSIALRRQKVVKQHNTENASSVFRSVGLIHAGEG
jgi:hypothetical protein